MFNLLNNTNALSVNCGTAFLLRDTKNQLDKYDSIRINCGNLVMSSEINAKLAEKSADINCGNSYVCDITGEVVQLKANSTLHNGMDFQDKCVMALGNLVLTPETRDVLKTASHVVVEDTLYYPDSNAAPGLPNVHGNIRVYPADAQLVLGSHTLKELITGSRKQHIWLAGTITALSADDFEEADKKGFTFTCDHLFSKEGLTAQAGKCISAQSCTWVPDDHEITESLELCSAHAHIYGSKIYVRGNLTIPEKAAESIDAFDSIIVEGCTVMNTVTAEKFSTIGKSSFYTLHEGTYRMVTGLETLSHNYFEGLHTSGEVITLEVSGVLLIDKDVTAEDMKAVASLSCSGVVILPGAAQSGLAGRLKNVTGMMGTIETIEQLTGLSLEEAVSKLTTGGNGSINTGLYVLT